MEHIPNQKLFSIKEPLPNSQTNKFPVAALNLKYTTFYTSIETVCTRCI